MAPGLLAAVGCSAVLLVLPAAAVCLLACHCTRMMHPLRRALPQGALAQGPPTSRVQFEYRFFYACGSIEYRFFFEKRISFFF